MGLDYRYWEAGETPRTDTLMLLTLDPLSNTAGMISIPRDMWVNIPGFDYAKINTAYYLGEINNLPGGGPALAVETVEQFIGVPIHFYAQVDFYAFAKFIDELGGLDLNVRDEIVVDPLGPANTVKLFPGVQTLVALPRWLMRAPATPNAATLIAPSASRMSSWRSASRSWRST